MEIKGVNMMVSMGVGFMSNIMVIIIVVDETVFIVVVIVRLVHYRGRRPRRNIAGWELPIDLVNSVDVSCKSTGCDVTTQG